MFNSIGIKLYLWYKDLKYKTRQWVYETIGMMNMKKLDCKLGAIKIHPWLLKLLNCSSPNDFYTLCGVTKNVGVYFEYHNYGINPNTYEDIKQIFMNSNKNTGEYTPTEIEYLWANYSPIDVQDAKPWHLYFNYPYDIRRVCHKYSDGYYFFEKNKGE